MEERVSGFRVRGAWTRVVRHGERISDAVREVVESRQDRPTRRDEHCLTEWDVWRPKPADRLDVELARRTARQASVPRGRGEAAGETPGSDLRRAGREFGQAVRELGSSGLGEAFRRVGDSIGYVARAADSAGRKTLRAAEEAVYNGMMTRMSPYYFDNMLISANVNRVRSHGHQEFEFEVNINDDALKQAVAARLESAPDRTVPTAPDIHASPSQGS